MTIMTEYLGEVEYTKEDIIHMEKGLYGFEEVKDYLLIQNPDNDLPYMWLQSIEDEKLSFIVTNPFYFVSDYDFELPDAVIKKLEVKSIEDIQILSIIVIPDKIENTTMNLKSPIILNHNINKGEQIILEGKYDLRYKLFQKEA